MSRRLTLAIFVGILGCLTVAAVTLLKIGIPLTQSDSASYIAWSPDRSPGYPFFVSLVAEMSPDYELLPPVQYLLLVAAVAAICDAFALLLRSPWRWRSSAMYFSCATRAASWPIAFLYRWYWRTLLFCSTQSTTHAESGWG